MKSPRKVIGLVFALALIIGGTVMVYVGLGHPQPMRLAWLGPIQIVAGLIWIASDWLGL